VGNELLSFFLRITRDEEAQDMVEYALLAGFIAVAAGAVLPPIAESISTIFSKMGSVTNAAAAQ
jgi:Flp pilus assembly pilin Flp